MDKSHSSGGMVRSEWDLLAAGSLPTHPGASSAGVAPPTTHLQADSLSGHVWEGTKRLTITQTHCRTPERTLQQAKGWLTAQVISLQPTVPITPGATLLSPTTSPGFCRLPWGSRHAPQLQQTGLVCCHQSLVPPLLPCFRIYKSSKFCSEHMA